MSTPVKSASAPDRVAKMARRQAATVIISVWSIPILLVGQFAMLAVVPVALVLLGTFRAARLRALRWWAVGLGIVYATPLIIWAVRPDRAPSLSKDIDAIFVILIIAASIALIVRYYTLRKL